MARNRHRFQMGSLSIQFNVEHWQRLKTKIASAFPLTFAQYSGALRPKYLQFVRKRYHILMLFFQAAKSKESQQSKDGEIKILRSRLDDKEKELHNHQQVRIVQMEQVFYLFMRVCSHVTKFSPIFPNNFYLLLFCIRE